MTTFDPTAPRLEVRAWVTGWARNRELRLVLDTGSTRTQIRADLLRLLGFDLTRPSRNVRLRSATGGAAAAVVVVPQLACLGQTRTAFPVVAHNLPPRVTVDGLLGLDFLRGRVLTLDFARGRITLTPPPRWWQFWR